MSATKSTTRSRVRRKTASSVLSPDGAEARPGPSHRLRIRAAAIDERRLHLTLDDVELGEILVSGLEPRPYELAIPPEVLCEGCLHELGLRIPDARGTEADPRPLGVAVVSVHIEAVPRWTGDAVGPSEAVLPGRATGRFRYDPQVTRDEEGSMGLGSAIVLLTTLVAGG